MLNGGDQVRMIDRERWACCQKAQKQFLHLRKEVFPSLCCCCCKLKMRCSIRLKLRDHGVTLQADINELMEKLNTYCECMKGPAGKVAG